MKDQYFFDLSDVKDFKIELLAEYIRAWLSKDKRRTIKDFVKLTGVSSRTIKSILNYKEGTSKYRPNPSKNTINAIINPIGFKLTISPIEDKDVIK